MGRIKKNTLKNEAARLLARLVPASRRAALAGLIPETSWETLDLTLYERVIDTLSPLEELGPEIVSYIQKRKYRIGSFPQSKSGAGWTVLGNVTIRPQDLESLHQPYVLSLIVHEIFHLQQQSIPMRLSMQGELHAWQYQQRTYRCINRGGRPIGSPGEAYGGKLEYWEKLASLSASSRADLEAARDLMIGIAPGYRAYSLPIYPLPQEIAHCWRQGGLTCILEMLRALLKGVKGEEIKQAAPEMLQS